MSQNHNKRFPEHGPDLLSEENQAVSPFSDTEVVQEENFPTQVNPVKEVEWICGSCDHENEAGTYTCSSCGGNLPILTLFRAQKIFHLQGMTIQVSWEIQQADEVILIPGDEPLPLSGTVEINSEVGDIYVLQASNKFGSRRFMTRAIALPPVLHSFTAVDKNIQLGYPVIFEWQVEHAQQIFIDGGVGEVSGQSYFEVPLKEPGFYTLTARNDAGEVSATIELKLPKPEISQFYAGAETIQLGMPITLYWEANNYEKLVLMPYELDITEKQNHDIYPDRTTDYYLLAKNGSGEVSKKLTLTLPPPVIRFFGSEDGISTEGSPVELTWVVENAHSVIMNHGIGKLPVNGQVEVIPNQAYTDYKIEVIGYSGKARASFRVTRFPIPLEEQLLALEAPDPFDVFENQKRLPQRVPNMAQMKRERQEEEEIAKDNKYKIWRAQQMMLTNEMMQMEKSSIRKEFQKIMSRFKSKKGSNENKS
ncbi:MAG: hypothetical protein AAFY71_22510 [Bacteroidota bacterium]